VDIVAVCWALPEVSAVVGGDAAVRGCARQPALPSKKIRPRKKRGSVALATPWKRVCMIFFRCPGAVNGRKANPFPGTSVVLWEDVLNENTEMAPKLLNKEPRRAIAGTSEWIKMRGWSLSRNNE
jgi:hypothetical protein